MKARSSLQRRLLAAFLAINAVLVMFGLMSLRLTGGLHARVGELSSRDLVPLGDLRTAQNTAYQITISGLVAASATDPAAVARMTQAKAEHQAKMGPALERMVSNTPAELGAQAQELVDTWNTFTAADLAYQQGAHGPQAAELNQRAAELFDQLNARFDAQADRLMEDAKARRASVDSSYATSRSLTLIALVVGSLSAVGLGFAFARSLRRRITPMVRSLESLAQRDLSSDVVVTGNDELTVMAAAMQRTIEALREDVGAIAAAASALSTPPKS